MTETSNTDFKVSATASLYNVLKKVIADLPQIEAYHTANSKPTPPDHEVSSFNHKHATVRGYVYHYVEEGDPKGIPIVLIHGFPELWYGWRNQIRHLEKEGYRVIAIDNLGFGGSDHPRCEAGDLDPYRAKNLAANVVELLTQLNIDKAVIIGHDWGASIAWKTGLHFPERCHAIIGLGIPHFQPAREYNDPETIAKMIPELGHFATFQSKDVEHWFNSDPHTQAVAYYNAMFAIAPGTNVEQKQYYIDQFTRTTFHGGYNLYRAGRLNYEDELPYVDKPYTVPSLLIVIDQDHMVPRTFVESQNTDTFVSLEIDHVDGDHGVHSTNPESVNQVFSKFLTNFFHRKDKSVQHDEKKARE